MRHSREAHNVATSGNILPMPPTPSGSPSPSEPPPTAAEILCRQNEPRALELLLAQRRMYSRAKRWNHIRVFGIVIIALGAPIITVTVSSSAEIVGAVAGGWIFLARTIFLAMERRWSFPAANIQDAFDVFVFSIPSNPAVAPEPEHIADIIKDDDVSEHAAKEHLLDWYSLDPVLPEVPAIAIAQQSNLAYSQRLLERHASVWLAIGISWACIAVAIGICVSLSLADFLLGIVLPVLPAVLDAYDLWRNARSAARDRSRLADALAARIRAWPSHSILSEDLRSWQDQIYRLRREHPLIPDFLYRHTRASNERAMSARSRELTASVLKG